MICDGTWLFQYDSETKRQVFETYWKISASPRIKKGSSEQVETLIVFFDVKGVIMTKCVPQGQKRINQYYYLQVSATFGDRVRRKWPELWENESWILHQD